MQLKQLTVHNFKQQATQRAHRKQCTPTSLGQNDLDCWKGKCVCVVACLRKEKKHLLIPEKKTNYKYRATISFSAEHLWSASRGEISTLGVIKSDTSGGTSSLSPTFFLSECVWSHSSCSSSVTACSHVAMAGRGLILINEITDLERGAIYRATYRYSDPNFTHY